jgi:hypothetical protein
MYWMQDKSSEKDAENCQRFNDLIRNPQLAAAPARSDAADPWAQLLGAGGLQQQQNGALSSSGQPAAANPFANLDLSNILRNVSAPASRPTVPATPGQPTFNLPPPPRYVRIRLL